MASKDELSEQLALTTKLAQQIERMSQAAERLSQSYDGQIAAVEKLAIAFQSVDTSGAVQKIEVLNKALTESANKMKDTGRTTEQTFTKMGKKIEDTGKSIAQRFPKSIAIGVAALTGFKAGLDNVIALGKGVGGFITGFVDGVANITASIIAIPFKMFQGLFDMAVKSAGGSNELAEAIEKLRKQFGELYGPTNKTIIDTSKSLKGFSDTGLSAWRVFGNLAQRLNELRELAEKMGPIFNNFLGEFKDNGGALLAYQKGLGLSGEEMKNVGVIAKATGQKMGGILKDFTKFSKALADSDTDAKLLSRDMGKMAGDVKHFGQLGAKELSEVAVYARKLGIEVDKMTGTLDAFESFDQSAENAAKLAQSFGANVDAFKLMEAQNPAEQFDMLRKSMLAVGKTSDTMSRQELKLLAQTAGMDEQTAKLAFSMKNQGMSLDEIKKKSGDAEKKTLTQAEAMSKLADAIERLTPQGGAMGFKNFWDAFFKGFLGGIQSSKEFREIMINIQRAVRLVYQEGVRLGRAFVEMFPGVQKFLGGIADFFKPEKFKKAFGGVTDVLIDWMHELTATNGKASFAGLMDRLKEKFFNFFDSETSSGKQMLEGFKTVFKTIMNVLGAGIKWASDKVGDGIQWIIGLITGKNKLNAGAAGAAGAQGLGFLEEALAPIGDALVHAWKTLAPKIWELVKLVAGKFYDFITSEEVLGKIKPAIPVLAGVLFGPAFGRALLAAGMSAIVQNLPALFGGAKSILGKVSSKVGEISGAQKSPKIGDKLPEESDAKAAAASGKVLAQGGKGINWGDVLKFVVGFAGVVAVGMGALFASIAIIRKFNITAKELVMGIAAVGAAATAMLPVAISLAIVSKFPIDPASAGIGILAIGLSILAMVGVLYLVVKALDSLDLAKVKTISEIMWDMSKVFLAAGGIVLIAMGIGAIILASVGIAAGALAAGLAAMVSGIAVMADAVIEIMKKLDGVPMGAGFKDKIEAFTKVMDSITNFAKNLTAILDAVRPSFITLLRGKDDTVERIDGVKSMLEAMIGKPGGAGIIGIIETIMKAMDQLANGDQRMLEGAKAFADIMAATAGLATAMKPPDKLFESIDGMFTTAGDVNTAMDKVTKYAQQITAGVGDIINVFTTQVMPLITGGGGLSDQQIKGAAAIGQLLGAVTQIAQNMTPSQGVIQSMRDQIGGTVGRDDFVLKPENMEALGKVITTIADGLNKVMPSVIGALTPVLAEIGKWKFTDNEVNAIKSIGPLLQQMMVMVQSITAQSSQLAQAKIPGVDVKTFIDKIGDVMPAILTSIANKIPDLFEGMKKGIQALQKDIKPEALKSGIETFKSLMAVLSSIPALAKDLASLSGQKAGAAPDLSNTDPLLQAVSAMALFLGRLTGAAAFGTSQAPLTELLNNINNIAAKIGDGGAGQKLTKTMDTLGKLFDGVSKTASNFTAMQGNVVRATADLKEKGIAPALEAVKQMVQTANDLDAALADGNVNKLDIKAKLGKVAAAVGLGGKATYTVNTGKNVVITVNMTVEMNAADMEKALIMRGSSIIRNRINFALNNASQNAGPDIPSSQVETLPDVSPGAK